MRVDRVFLDTNVLLSGLIFEGNESRLLELAVEGRIRLVIADIVLKEAREVLDAKFPRQAGALDQFLRLVEYESVPLPDDEAVSRARSMLRDPGDAPVLASMTASNPDAAVTGDKDLLTPEIREILPVMTCRDYLSSHGR